MFIQFDKATQRWAKQYPIKPDLGTLDNDRNEWLVIDADPESINILAGIILGKLYGGSEVALQPLDC